MTAIPSNAEISNEPRTSVRSTYLTLPGPVFVSEVPDQFSSRLYVGQEVWGNLATAPASAPLAEVGLPDLGRKAFEYNQLSREQPPARSLYPQAFDETVQIGKVRNLIELSYRCAQQALDAYDDSELITVSNSFSLISAHLANAAAQNTGERALNGILHFVRRAVMVVDVTDLSREHLNSLITVLKSLSVSPLVSLADAANMRRSLVNAMWNGDHQDVTAIVGMFKTLFTDADEVPASVFSYKEG